MKRLSINSIIEMHKFLIAKTGGVSGIRDKKLLESALNAPFQTFDGEHLYPTIQARAARLAYSLIKNHPFVDGNKRIGILAMLVYLEINKIKLQYTNDELISIGQKLADNSIDDKYLCEWIMIHSQ